MVEDLALLFKMAKEKDIELFNFLASVLSVSGDLNYTLSRCPPSKLKSFVLSQPDWRSFLTVQKEELQGLEAKILTPLDAQYPKQLLQLSDPPIFLSVKGIVPEAQRWHLSVVGSRNPSHESLNWMEHQLTQIVKKDCVLVSGAARGIDQRAHQLCLRNRKPTIAFLPSGLAQIYPQSFVRWQNDIIASGGCLISEYLPGEPMRTHHFHERNRMIAAYSPVLLVVEARLKSGSIMTANKAAEMGKPLATVPSFPDNLRFQGNLKLLFDGAQMVRDAYDLLALLSLECRSESSSPAI